MKKLILLAILLVPTLLLAEDAEAVYNAAIEKARVEMESKVKVARDKYIVALKVEKDALTKKGDLDGAIKIRDKIAELEKQGNETAGKVVSSVTVDLIDLMSKVDPIKDALKGTWLKSDEALTYDRAKAKSPNGILQIPYHPPSEYDWRMTVEPFGGSNRLHFNLSNGEHSHPVIIAANEVGLEKVGNAISIPANRKSVLEFRVRKDGFTVYVNDTAIAKGKIDNLPLNNYWTLPNDGCLGVGTHETDVRFYSIEIRELSGKGRSVDR